jgi:hypothetical protein
MTDTTTANSEATMNSPSNGCLFANPQSYHKTVWYLGGNHAAKLLTSVEGDLDPDVLAKLASVPAVIGELALSVESLVSDDFTVGGFENDLLAKIAANTLNARKKATTTTSASEAVMSPSPQPPSFSTFPTNAEIPAQDSPTFVEVTGNVPNPLLENYDPVPNPLARITPPGSPTPVIENDSGNKRKDSPVCQKEEAEEHYCKSLRTSGGHVWVQAR